MGDVTSLAVAEQNKGLAKLDQAKILLTEAKEGMDLSIPGEMYAQMAAATAYLERGTAAHIEAAEIKLRAARCIGEISSQIPTDAGGRPNNSPHDGESLSPTESRGTIYDADAPTKKQVLAEHGIPVKHVDRFEKVASLPEDQFEAYLADCKNGEWDKGNEATINGAIRLANGGKLAAFSSESIEWYTPGPYIEAARQALGGHIDLDPASSERANKTVKAKHYWSAGGLTDPWKAETVWCNPPYGGEDGTAVWVQKALLEHQAGSYERGILLVNAVTDRKWFKPLFKFPICFTDHRIEFYTPGGQPRSPVSGNAFVGIGVEPEYLAGAFLKFGTTVIAVTGQGSL